MARKKRNLTPEERAERTERTARYAATTRLLEERIAYHRAKLKEEYGPDGEPPSAEEYVMSLGRKRDSV